MKHVEKRPYADPDAAARRIVQLATSIEPVQDGRIHIEKINASFLSKLKVIGPEFGAGIKYAIEKGWLDLHESGTYVQLLTSGENLLDKKINQRPENTGMTLKSRYIVQYERPKTGRFKVVNPTTHEPAIGEDGKPLGLVALNG